MKLADGTFLLNGEPASIADEFRFKGEQTSKLRKEYRIQGYQHLTKHILISILVAFIWFLFWESIVYRSVLYIVFGKKK